MNPFPKATPRPWRPLAERFNAKVARAEPDQCWLWTASQNGRGYGYISQGGRGRHLLAHRVAYEFANGPIPPGLIVLHRCDVPACVNPRHLRLGTPTDNMQDAINKGRFKFRHPCGEANPHAKLTAEQVMAIRERKAAAAATIGRIGAEYGVSESTVKKICNGDLWPHVGGPIAPKRAALARARTPD